MAVRTRITSYEKTFKLVLDRNLSPEARSKRVAAFAQTEIDAADAQNRSTLGSVPPKTVTVDGKQGAPLESVNPDRGTIIAEWSLVGDVLQWIFATLRARSPRVSGDYQEGHTLYADGAECDPANPPLAREYIFFNPVPYSRKIEVGKTKSGRDFVIQVENKIYKRTADDAKARFGNIASISSGFAPSGYSLKADQKSRSFTGGKVRISARQRPDRTAGSSVTVPTIVVTLK